MIPIRAAIPNIATPTPIPAWAPLLNPSFDVGAAVFVGDVAGVVVVVCDADVLVADCVAELEVVELEVEELEVEVVLTAAALVVMLIYWLS